jgi:hypothetical protein
MAVKAVMGALVALPLVVELCRSLALSALLGLVDLLAAAVAVAELVVTVWVVELPTRQVAQVGRRASAHL